MIEMMMLMLSFIKMIYYLVVILFVENALNISPLNYVMKKSITLDQIAEVEKLPYPDLIKIDAQGAELNILKGATHVLKCCSYLILELQDFEYNEKAPHKDVVIEYLKSIGFYLFSEKFSKNVSDADYCFINALRTNVINNSLF
jgi:hypothetical protein